MRYHQEQMIIFSETYINSQIYFNSIFGVYMYQFAAAQQTLTRKLAAFFQRSQTEECVRRVKALKLFRILFILWCLSAAFWDMTRFINQSLVSLFHAKADYNRGKNSS